MAAAIHYADVPDAGGDVGERERLPDAEGVAAMLTRVRIPRIVITKIAAS